MVRNESTMATSLAGRRCLTDSFVALLPVKVQHSVYSLLVCAIRPTGGDTTISTFNKALSPSGFFLETVSTTYNASGNYPLHLLKERSCQLIMIMRLVDHTRNIMSHTVAWDGRRIIDCPESLEVEDGDRGHKQNRNLVFVKLFPPREFKTHRVRAVLKIRRL